VDEGSQHCRDHVGGPARRRDHLGGLATIEICACGDALAGGAAPGSDRPCGQDCGGALGDIQDDRLGGSPQLVGNAPTPGGCACNAIHRRRQILCQVVDPQPFRPSNSFRTFVHGELRHEFPGKGIAETAPAVPRPSSPAVCRPPFVARRLSPAVCRPPFVARRLSPAVCRPPFVARRLSPLPATSPPRRVWRVFHCETTERERCSVKRASGPTTTAGAAQAIFAD
jgi:hypothetical protein